MTRRLPEVPRCADCEDWQTDYVNACPTHTPPITARYLNPTTEPVLAYGPDRQTCLVCGCVHHVQNLHEFPAEQHREIERAGAKVAAKMAQQRRASNQFTRPRNPLVYDRNRASRDYDAAVMSLQRRLGITVDGIWGPRTAEAVEAAYGPILGPGTATAEGTTYPLVLSGTTEACRYCRMDFKVGDPIRAGMHASCAEWAEIEQSRAGVVAKPRVLDFRLVMAICIVVCIVVAELSTFWH